MIASENLPAGCATGCASRRDAQIAQSDRTRVAALTGRTAIKTPAPVRDELRRVRRRGQRFAAHVQSIYADAVWLVSVQIPRLEVSDPGRAGTAKDRLRAIVSMFRSNDLPCHAAAIDELLGVSHTTEPEGIEA
jgi:hypothetical protein